MPENFHQELIHLLKDDESLWDEEFEEIDGHWIFNAHAFTNYLSSKNFLANSYTRFRNKIGLNICEKYLHERAEETLQGEVS